MSSKNIPIIFLIFALMGINSSKVNGQVQSKSFRVMLNMLLSSKTPAISVNEAKASTKDHIFLDAREQEEYEVSHIAKAKFVGYENFDLGSVNNIARQTPIIVYCSVGKRSENITNKLIDAGFTNVKNLYGGIFEWVNEGNEVVDSKNIAVNKVHAYNYIWGMWLQKGEKVY